MLPISQEDFYFLRRVSLALVNNLQEYGQALATTGWERGQDKANKLSVWSPAEIIHHSRSLSLPSLAISSRNPLVASSVLCPQIPKFYVWLIC